MGKPGISMKKVKGSPQYRMKVVPHRPLRSGLLGLLGVLVVVGMVAGSYHYAAYQAEQGGMSAGAASTLRAERDQLRLELNGLRQQLTQAQMSTEVDRKAAEELRQRLLVRREQIAQLERDVSVYRMMSARSSNNPMGISFGTFSAKPVTEAGVHHVKLVVQKLAESDAEFTGVLEANLVGKLAGVEQRYPLAQVAITPEAGEPLSDKIPVEFKYFQTIETDLRLPDGFEPERLDVRLVSSSRSNPLTLESQLEWVKADE